MTAIFDPVKVSTTDSLSVSSTSPLNLEIPLDGSYYKIDGVLLSIGDRILVREQDDPTQNGIFVVISGSLLERASDFADAAVVSGGTIVFVQQGDTHADTGHVVSTDGDSTVGSSIIRFSRFSVNPNVIGNDLQYSILYREELGRPLSNLELDNNFKYLSVALSDKVDTVDYTGPEIANRLNALSYAESQLNANKLRDLLPSEGASAPLSSGGDPLASIVIRSDTSTISSEFFVGDLIGTASNLLHPSDEQGHSGDYYTNVNNIDAGILDILYGGTGADNANDAVTSLGAVHIAGDTMEGTLTFLESTTGGSAPINLPKGVKPSQTSNYDIWNNNDAIVYQNQNGSLRTFAFLEGPILDSATVKTNPNTTSNDKSLASTSFTQTLVGNLKTYTDTNLALKSPIASPAFTGTPTAPTPVLGDNGTRIATTAYVTSKINDTKASYYTKTQVNTLFTNLKGGSTRTLQEIDTDVQENKAAIGVPVGTVMYFAASATPLGWLECNGRQYAAKNYPVLAKRLKNAYGGNVTYDGNGNITNLSTAVFNLPDLRGEFIRGWDHSRGADSGRSFATWQADEFKSHTHRIRGGDDNPGWSGQKYAPLLPHDDAEFFANDPNSIEATGGVETRPRNVAMLPCIKAFGELDDEALQTAATLLNQIQSKVAVSGDTMTGFLTLHANPTSNLHAATKSYVDTKIDAIDVSTIALMKNTTSAQTTLGKVRTPATASGDASTTLTTKSYVDDKYDELFNNSGTPVGSIMYYPSSTIPFGWMECDGRNLSKTTHATLFEIIGYTYGGSGANFKIPDLRGEFIRGWDHGRGTDPNRALGSWQKSSVIPFDPSYTSIAPGGLVANNDPSNEAGKDANVLAAGFDLIDYNNYTSTLMTNAGNSAGSRWALDAHGWRNGGTRPRNVALVACIKVMGSIDNPDQILAANVLTDIAGKVIKSGDTMTGFLTLHANPTSNLHAATKSYVDTEIAAIDVSTVALVKNTTDVQTALGKVRTPATASGDASTTLTTKSYVDDKFDEIFNSMSGAPVGTITWWSGSTPPVGWLECKGQYLSRITYDKLYDVIGSTYGSSGWGLSFRIPDLRGEFIRGWDHGRGVDSNRTLGSSQSESFKSHKHAIKLSHEQGGSHDSEGYPQTDGWGGKHVKHEASEDDGSRSYNNGKGNPLYSEGGTETRPRNVALMPIIKAVGGVTNQDQVDLSTYINQLSTKLDYVAGGTMQGALNVPTPTAAAHAVTKSYVDTKVAAATNYTITSGATSVNAYSSKIGLIDNSKNYFDVYPPSGKTMSNLVAFMPSISWIFFAGVVNGDDILRCSYAVLSNYVRVWVHNSEQRGKGNANWIAIWS